MNIKTHPLTATDAKLFEKLVSCDHALINHAVLPAGDGFAMHRTDSYVFILILRGTISLTFADGSAESFAAGQLIEVPFQILMKIDNFGTEPLELVVVKAPHPETIKCSVC